MEFGLESYNPCVICWWNRIVLRSLISTWYWRVTNSRADRRTGQPQTRRTMHNCCSAVARENTLLNRIHTSLCELKHFYGTKHRAVSLRHLGFLFYICNIGLTVICLIFNLFFFCFFFTCLYRRILGCTIFPVRPIATIQLSFNASSLGGSFLRIHARTFTSLKSTVCLKKPDRYN